MTEERVNSTTDKKKICKIKNRTKIEKKWTDVNRFWNKS